MIRPIAGVLLLAVLPLVAAADRSHGARATTPGKHYFEANVVPKLAENGCPLCHSRGYVHPNVVVYEELLPYLAMGVAAETTPVIRKIANLRAFRPDIPTHVGGPRCETLDSEPCKSILQWWQIEFGAMRAEGARP